MILCITHSNDVYTIDRVLDYFEKNNTKAIRIDTDLLLTSFSIVKKLSDSGPEVIVKLNDNEFNISEITGVWFRKIWPPSILDEIEEGYRDDVGKEINTNLFSFFNLLEKQVPCINFLSKTDKVEGNKFFQLCQAQKVGLKIPDTLISSDFNEVKQFYERYDNSIVAKLQNSLSFSMGAGAKFFPTTLINKDNIEMLGDTITCCPMIFQNNIPKAYELRIAYVEGVCFTGKINAANTKKGKQDWRCSELESAHWEAYELPEGIVSKIDLMMCEFGLSFGAIDMIRQPNGDYVFLEVNPSGEWGMLQRDLGFPIAETIAKTLLKRIELYEK